MTVTKKKATITSVVVATGITLGVVIGSISGANIATGDTSIKTNENGQTLGTIYEVEQAGMEVDLLAATATNGREGYVYSKDFEGDQPRSPEEAATWNETHKDGRTINVYAEDGKTVIGEFVFDEAKLTLNEAPPKE